MVRVTVVLPVHRSGGRAKAAAESVLRQSHQDLELVAVDDGGDEDLAALLPSDPRLTLLSQRNHGVSVTRNVGAAAGTGELIAFIDQDDTWAEDKLSRQLDDVVAADADFGHTGFRILSPASVFDASAGRPFRYPDSLCDHYICLSSVIVRASTFRAVGGFDPLLRIQQDFDLNARVGLVTDRTVFTPGPLVDYHVHGDNASRDYRALSREASRIFDDHAARALMNQDEHALEVIRRARADNRRLTGVQALQRFRDTRDPSDLGRALLATPGAASKAIGTYLTTSRRGA